MTTRFLMNASNVAMGATVASLTMLYLRHRVKFPALLAYLASEVLYRAYELGWGLGYEAACWRECTYGLIGVGVAVDALSRAPGSLQDKKWVAEGLGVGVLVLAGLGGVGMGLPGGHADYRMLIPVALSAALCLVTAHRETTQTLDKTACWALGMVFLAQVGEYLGWEFGPSWALLGAWIHTGAYLWAMLEITLATKHA